jgi:hypothetical protein
MKFLGLLVTSATLLTFSTYSPAGATTTNLTVNAQDVIYAAGQPSALTGTGGQGPASFSVSGGATLTFSVTGSVVLNATSGHNSNDPDGIGAAPSSSWNSGYGSISGITAPNAGYLVGVFVAASGPSGSAPVSLNFTSSGIGTSFASLSPQLDQVFFIGDGLTGDGTGTTQAFIAPSGTGALYLGISDACRYNGGPSCYGDNYGNFSVTATSSVPEPATWAMMLLGFGGLGFVGYRRALKGAATLAAA